MSPRGVFDRAARRLSAGIGSARLLGTGAAKHLLGRISGRPTCEVTVRGVGRVTVRPSEPDLASLRQMLGTRELEINVPAIAEALSKRCKQICASGSVPVIVDAGAYIGASALWFRKAYPAAHVVAVEPDPESFALLQHNVRGREKVTAIEAAVAARAGHVQMVPMEQSWANRVERSKSGVKAITMDEAFAAVPGGEPFIAKVNIEGFESELFSANLGWLDTISALFIEPHDWLLPGKRPSGSFQKAVASRDFHLLILGSNLCYVRV